MDCIFCKIVQKEIPANILYEDADILAFSDIQPLAPVHILIIPKKHIDDMASVAAADWGLISQIHQVAQRLAQEAGIAESGYRLINNCRQDSGQLVPHLHYHLLGGQKLGSFN